MKNMFKLESLLFKIKLVIENNTWTEKVSDSFW